MRADGALSREAEVVGTSSVLEDATALGRLDRQLYRFVSAFALAGGLAVFVTAVWRGMRWLQLRTALVETAKLSVMIFTIIWGVLVYVRFLGFADLPGAFAAWITSLDQTPFPTLILILLPYAVLGMFMDAIGMLILTLPVVYPAVIALNGGETVTAADSAFGMSGIGCAIWFGIIVVKMAELCLITPPIGLNCFVVAGVHPELTVQDVFKGAAPFFVADALTIAELLCFPPSCCTSRTCSSAGDRNGRFAMRPRLRLPAQSPV